MAASIKISELNSLTDLTDVDLFLVSDMESGTSKKVSYSSLKSNLVDNLTTAVSDLTEVVSQNNTTLGDRITVLETEINNLDIDIAPETLDSINELAAAMGGDPAFLTTVNNRLAVLETDPTTQTYVDNINQSIQVSLGTLASDIDQNEADADAAIAALQTRVATIEGDNATDTELDAYKAYVDDMNFQLMLAYDTPTYIDTLFGG